MTTTIRGAGVTIGELARLAAEQLLQVRRVYLKGRAPKSRYVHQLRRDIACGKARPVTMLFTLSCADLDDGAALPLALAPYQSMIAGLTEYHERRTARDAGAIGNVLPLVQRESRMDAELRAAENDLLAHPESLEAQRRVEAAIAADEAEMDRLVAAVRANEARVTINAVAVQC